MTGREGPLPSLIDYLDLSTGTFRPLSAAGLLPRDSSIPGCGKRALGARSKAPSLRSIGRLVRKRRKDLRLGTAAQVREKNSPDNQLARLSQLAEEVGKATNELSAMLGQARGGICAVATPPDLNPGIRPLKADRQAGTCLLRKHGRTHG